MSFTLQPNQVSDLVTSAYGYHIIKLLEKIPPQKVEFVKAEERIKDALMMIELEKQMPLYLERVKKEAAVEILLNKDKK